MQIIIHISDSSFGNAALIDSWHRANGWNGIGYHYVILNGQLSPKVNNDFFDGHIETGRPLDDDGLLESFEYGAHARGLNRESIAICLIGKSGIITDKQKVCLNDTLYRLEKQFAKIIIKQHSDVDPVNKPDCAGLDTEEIKESFAEFRKMMVEVS